MSINEFAEIFGSGIVYDLAELEYPGLIADRSVPWTTHYYSDIVVFAIGQGSTSKFRGKYFQCPVSPIIYSMDRFLEQLTPFKKEMYGIR